MGGKYHEALGVHEKEVTMDPVQQIKILLGNCRAARANAAAADDAWVGHVTGMEQGVLQLLAEIDQLERQRGALRAKLKAEFEDGHRRLEAQNLRIKEAHRTAEQLDKENDRRRAVGRAMFASIP
jgi:hypothetical protein